MKLEDYFKNGKVYIWKEKFSVIKAKKIDPNAFANIIDKNEITVIIEESKVNQEDVIKIEKGWKIITFDMILPFELTGFMAAVSKVLAEEKISIFAISAYSTDHVLIKEEDFDKAKKKLEQMGCIVVER
ncbi:MAG: ACT domain-containing protein [Nanoarchaeota archaeon]|nr:ACT domain-containing protein [Nanoarchaeota archaeon]